MFSVFRRLRYSGSSVNCDNVVRPKQLNKIYIINVFRHLNAEFLHVISLTFTVCMLTCSCLCNHYKKYKISVTSAASKH